MKRWLVLLVLPVLLMSNDVVVSDVPFKNAIVRNGKSLVLNGVGVREKYFIDLYVAGLYLPQKNNNAAQITQAEENQGIRLVIVSSLITYEKFKKVTLEGFNKATKNNLAPYQKCIDQFLLGFGDSFAVGDEYELDYQPGGILKIFQNKELKQSIPCGIEFKKIVLSIWLGEDPADEELKEDLLGLD